MNILEDTIAAIATPPGEAGISVIRVSGPDSIHLCDKRFRGRKALKDALTHTAHFGDFCRSSGEKIDEVVATIFRSPNSFTTEDIVEISCHGGIYVTTAILRELISGGARSAEPGEFTKRAFLNGRIDLSQAEAVADLIHSRSKLSHFASVEQLSGKISVAIQLLRQKILDTASLLELELDFSEEGVDLLRHDDLIGRLSAIITEMEEMLRSYSYGRIIRDGVRVVLTGRPNVGKSSILNNLLNYNRAIVSEIPGTTRDTLEENFSIDGLLFNITDTAGLRASSDKVEELGIERARRALQMADVVLFILDATKRPGDDDIELLEQCRSDAIKENAQLLLIENKIDLPHAQLPIRGELAGLESFRVSATSGAGMRPLREALLRVASAGHTNSFDGSIVITNHRHQECLMQALEFARKAILVAEGKSNSELIAENLNMSTKALGEIIGMVTSEDVLNNIFSSFCIGK